MFTLLIRCSVFIHYWISLREAIKTSGTMHQLDHPFAGPDLIFACVCCNYISESSSFGPLCTNIKENVQVKSALSHHRGTIEANLVRLNLPACPATAPVETRYPFLGRIQLDSKHGSRHARRVHKPRRYSGA